MTVQLPGSHVHTGRGGVGGWGEDESVRWHSFQVGVGWVGGVGMRASVGTASRVTCTHR